MKAFRHLNFLKLAILSAGFFGGPICVTVPNFVPIGQTLAEI